MLEPLGYQVDVRPQKGQLRDYQLDRDTDDYPVVMPEGELDIIPFQMARSVWEPPMKMRWALT